MHRNEIIYALICINSHVLSCIISMLSVAIEEVKNLSMTPLIEIVSSLITYEMNEA